nr:hypothetical protein [Kibdelosporangium sp. MJ126-NF4]CEL16715.1 hypothetical protein [Kibdelosporangium sp. MJ126-NF4]CTQ92056.1 hypothetical protein [Kibdelosporangium sp. MJ126-NF4]
MNDTVKDQTLTAIREEIATMRKAAEAEQDPAKRDRLLQHAQIREEVAEEEAEAIATEVAENQQSALSVRIPTALMAMLKARAEAEHISTSALARRLLTDALQEPNAQTLTVEQVEQIARRVYRESA